MHHKKYIEILQILITEKCQKYIYNPAIFITFLLQFLLLFQCNSYYFSTVIFTAFPLYFFHFSNAFFATFSMPKIHNSHCILRKTKIFQKISSIKYLAIFVTSSQFNHKAKEKKEIPHPLSLLFISVP